MMAVLFLVVAFKLIRWVKEREMAQKENLDLKYDESKDME